MANFSKPTDIPRWADTGVIVVPSNTKQDSGWVAPELPPDTFFNWHQNLVGLWVKWLDERLLDGSTDDDFVVHAPDPSAGVGGRATFRGGDSPDAAGGIGEVTGGDANGAAGDGGNAILQGGSPGSDAGTMGGTANVRGGDNTVDGLGGAVNCRAGDSTGTDRDAGAADVSTGRSTGSGFGTARIRAATAGTTGAATHAPETYFEADGQNEENKSLKTLIITPTSAAKPAVRLVGQASDPTSAIQGDTHVRSQGGKLHVHNGTAIDRYVAQSFASIVDADVSNFFGAIAFSEIYTIPANTLRAGSTIRVRASVQHINNLGGGTVEFDLRIDGVKIAETSLRGLTAIGNDGAFLEGHMTVRGTGATAAVGVGGHAEHGVVNASGLSDSTVIIDGTSTIDTTSPIIVEARGAFSIADPNNIVRLFLLTVDVL